jgi:diacylglycerol kinase family enzyme
VILYTRRRHVRVAVDGEVFKFKTPLLFKSLPGALRVISGQESVVSESRI